ncbi:GGDEF domain-containing protein [Isoalcanivorax beigongshangi]|uniref:diguanylate cyclase n=1 Tax=Isoalcanivorax beigongshangi TaxID=3238810 RepID=A0ABV4ALA8_9GAMM
MHHGQRSTTGTDSAPPCSRGTLLRALRNTLLLTLAIIAVSLLGTGIAVLATGERNWLFALTMATLMPLLLTPCIAFPLLRRNAALMDERQQLLLQARHDHLTGLFNRPYMLRMLERELALSARHRYPVSVVLLELRNSRELADQLGRLAADAALQLIAREVRGLIRESDLFGRFEATQFLLVLPHTAQRDAERISATLGEHLARQQVTQDGRSLLLCLCAGVGATGNQPRTAQQLLNDADYGLYNARKVTAAN